MPEAQDPNSAAEPSMEEILASIRKIIADEKEPASAPLAVEAEEPIDLTQMVQDDGSVVDLAAPAPSEPAPEPAPEPEPVKVEKPIDDSLDISFEPIPAPVPEPEPVPSPVLSLPEDSLLSDTAASAATSALAALVHTVQHEKQASLPSFTPLGDGSRTLEDMVLELMKPMLKSWLDQNLPAIVDRLVQKEVEKIVKRAQE